MKNYELTAQEIELVMGALRFTAEYGFNHEYENKEHIEDCNDMKALIERLDPKPVKKSAWMVIYPDESRSRLFDYQYDAEGWANYDSEKSKVVKVTWEE